MRERAKGYRDQIKTMSAALRNTRAAMQAEREENHNLRIRQKEALDGVMQLSTMCDAILAVMAAHYGDKTEDNGEVIGYRLTLPTDDITEALSKYHVHVKKDDNGDYLIGAVINK